MNAQRLDSAALVLLIESDNLVRSTVASICRDLKLVRILQASSLASGEPHLLARPVQGLMLSLVEGDAAIELLERLRAGAFACEPDIPVMVLTSGCTKEQLVRLKALEVRRLLLQPFLLRDVINTVEQLWPLAEPEAQRQASGMTSVS